MAIAPPRRGIAVAPRQLIHTAIGGAWSVHDPAAVDAQELAGDERAFGYTEEHHRAGDVRWRTAPLYRLLGEDVGGVALAVGMDLFGSSRERSGQHGVDRDPVLAALAGQRAGRAKPGTPVTQAH